MEAGGLIQHRARDRSTSVGAPFLLFSCVFLFAFGPMGSFLRLQIRMQQEVQAMDREIVITLTPEGELSTVNNPREATQGDKVIWIFEGTAKGQGLEVVPRGQSPFTAAPAQIAGQPNQTSAPVSRIAPNGNFEYDVMKGGQPLTWADGQKTGHIIIKDPPIN